jgi:CBS domain-containing protein
MKVRDILNHKGNSVATVRPDTTVATVIHRLMLERIGALVVSDDGSRVLGIISERDIVRIVGERGAEALAPDLTVEQVMTRHVLTCGQDDSVKDLMSTMTQRRIRHLPVVEDGRMIGIVSIGDVVKNRVEEVELEANVLREYIHLQ